MKGKTCDSCIHWKPQPVNVADLGAKREGQCREGPPDLTILPNGAGGFTQIFAYPQLPQDFAACDRHKAAADVPGPESQAGRRSSAVTASG